MKLSITTKMRALALVPVVFTILSAANATAQTDSTVVDSTAVDSTVVDSTAAPAPAPSTAPPPPAATTAAATQTPPPAAEPKKKRDIFYGGTIGLTFGDYTRIAISPMIGTMLNPRVAVGVEATYEYIEQDAYGKTFKSSNYGGGAFARFFPIPRIYGHAEFDYMSYELQVSTSESERTWVPFLLLGGGLVQRMNARTALTIEVLFDVLQDENSPYDSGEPFVSVGVGVGI
jgi:biotin carboxyl carrier protein